MALAAVSTVSAVSLRNQIPQKATCRHDVSAVSPCLATGEIKTKQPVIRKIYNDYDEATEQAFEVFQFRAIGGRRRHVSIEREKAQNAKYVVDELLRKNIDLAHVDDLQTSVETAISSEPGTRRKYAKRLGWRNRGKSFVTAMETLGAPTSLKTLPPRFLSANQHCSIERVGTVNAWKEGVAAICRYSDVAMLAVAAAFAAPLLKSSGLQSFGINIYGRSKVGKTASLLAASSFYGIGREPRLPNWNSSPAARSEMGRIVSDLMLPVNEVGLAASSKKATYDTIRQFIYAISEGRDKSRHSLSSFASSSTSAEFRTIFVSTAEHSFNDHAAASGQTRDLGEYARCLDVPATRSGPIIFDRRPKGASRVWAQKQLQLMREACEANHGVALPPFIEHLVGLEGGLRERVQSLIEHFTAGVPSSAKQGVLQHAAKNFGLLYAGAFWESKPVCCHGMQPSSSGLSANCSLARWKI
ncbi:DUF927 domain-containing protein [Kaistia terrae]|uniref:DUF927 domain-containing protein n=1 Tax=Kaistia terrae TaxID=537017 RepID=A0ABW0Q470_9HYPH|nr:DUF927 domain-containing protein [Kaistia terrae]MCX5581221.1 DUF927 domain-containing protein [Kaistia terrae]